MYNIINALAKYMITCFKLIVKRSYFTVTVFIIFNCVCLLGAKRLPKGLSTELVIFARVWEFPNFMCWLVASKAYVTEVAESQFTAVVVEFPTDWSGSGVCLVSPRTGTLS